MENRFVGYFTFFLLALSALAQEPEKYPKPTGYVNDFAGVLDSESARRLDALCREVEEKTGVQMALVTVKNLGGNDVKDFANRLFKVWGIGQKGKDNGILMVDAIEDRQIWIEVGYGLEGILPDGKVGSIRDEDIFPELKKENRGTAYLAGFSAMAQVIIENAGGSQNGQPQQRPRYQRRAEPGFGRLIGLLIPLLIFMLFFGRRGGGCLWPMIFMGGFGNRGWGGGSLGGGSFGGGFGGGFGGFGGGASGGGGAGGGY